MALYDPNEFPAETKVGADFTLADVLAWAGTKPADEEYHYVDPDKCAVAQFGLETGRPGLVGLLSSEIDAHCPGLEDLANSGICGGDTFGAFVARLERSLSA